MSDSPSNLNILWGKKTSLIPTVTYNSDSKPKTYTVGAVYQDNSPNKKGG